MALPIKWGGSDCFTHLLVVGPTRSGKTATILKPMIYQLLKMKKSGIPLGLSVIEPKGDVAQMVADVAHEMELPYTHIDPTKNDTAHFNPMEGDTNTVAEATVVVLKGLFGKQDAFFATVQELSARNVTKLLKELHGDDIDILDVMNTLRDPAELKRKVADLKAKQGQTDLVHFFESELLGSMADKYRQFVIGLRAQLENIVSNDALRNIMTGKSSINIDEHFSSGGIFAVNTALGMLRSSGDAFGQFLIMHLQNGTFRRKGTEDTRIPHFLIVDEYSRYINPDVEIFLSLAAEYKVAGIFATQSLGQLEIESGKINAKAMKRSIMASCRNKMVFGGVTMEDAKDFAEEFGKDKIMMRQSTYKFRYILPMVFPDSFRDTEDEEYRFDPTDIRDGLPRFTYIHQLMQGGVMQKPAIAKGVFVPRDWKELKEWEGNNKKKYMDRFKKKFKKNNSDSKSFEQEVESEATLLEEIEKESVKEQRIYETKRQMIQKEYLESVTGEGESKQDSRTKESDDEKVNNVVDIRQIECADSTEIEKSKHEDEPLQNRKVESGENIKSEKKTVASSLNESYNDDDGFWS